MLDVLGLDDHEALAYRCLVERPSGSATELAQATGLDSLDAARILAALEGKGLAARSTSGQDRYVASPPGVALGALLVQRQEDLRRAQAEMAELAGLYRGAAARRDVTDVVDVVRGVDAISQRFAQLQSSAKREVHVLVKSDVAVVSREDNEHAESQALQRGVRYHVVVERSAFDRPGFYAAAEEGMAAGEEIRVAGVVPLRMLIVDRELAIIPLVSGAAAEPVHDALLVHSSGLLDALLALFDFVWDAAPRLVRGNGRPDEVAGDRLAPIDAKILSLLLAGLTDHSIGSQLGLSLRTVQRKVRQMMDLAQVDTRLQLGYEASRRAWV